jgi:hypothetical protein
MHGVNLDLLQTTPYRADGAARDPYARHSAEHRAALRAVRRARRQAVIARVIRTLSRMSKAGVRTLSGLPQA